MELLAIILMTPLLVIIGGAIIAFIFGFVENASEEQMLFVFLTSFIIGLCLYLYVK